MADLPSKKAAPRREVLEIIREGDWGEVVYRHRLGCGHVDVRKRPAKATEIACLACVAGKMLDARTPPIPQAARPAVEIVDPLDTLGPLDEMLLDETVAVEMDINTLRAGLASRFGIPAESVDVVIAPVDGRLSLAYATVFLDAAAARRLAGP